MKHIILLMVLALMFLPIMAAAESICERYGFTGSACEVAVKRYQQLTNPITPEGKSVANTCKNSGGGCIDKLARAEAFGDTTLNSDQVRAVQTLGIEITEETKAYEVRDKLVQHGMTLSQAVVRMNIPLTPDKEETDGLKKTYSDGTIPSLGSGNPAFVDFGSIPDKLKEDMNQKIELHARGVKWGMVGGKEIRMPISISGVSDYAELSPQERAEFDERRTIEHYHEYAATYAEMAEKGKPLPKSSLDSMSASRDQLEADISSIEEKYGSGVAQAARELVNAIDLAASKGSNVPSSPSEAGRIGKEIQQPENPASGPAVGIEDLGKKVDWIKCPDGCDYPVQKGDSYWNLAKRIPDTDIKMEALMEINEGKPLIAGVTILRIPSKDEFLDYAFKKEKYFSPFQCKG